MKGIFFALSALAASAFAAPSIPSNGAIDVRTDDKASGISLAKRDDADADGLINILSSGFEDVKKTTSAIKVTLAEVQSNTKTKDEAKAETKQQLNTLNSQLSSIFSKVIKIKDAKVQTTDLDHLLQIVVGLLKDILVTVESLLKILGVNGDVTSILHSVFGLVANIVTGVIKLVDGIVPGLVKALEPLLSALGNGVLAPLLGVVAGLLKALAGGH